ncbi:hypothetical protein PVL29_001795 [Vitis rotundifolia]|uniref:Short-chain dehydrogenase TIC 32, chloroplastic n=1 Tax=Vitis rotundifolia TaxID=103349 RepID=A0AA39E469_VITRO|nr:hypothetical protein PVL29_001795 [Vitis rotundifolia]
MWIFGRKGPSGFSACSTAEEVAQGIDGNGLTAVVTGASSGIGTETSRVLALHGVHVIMAVRNMDAGRNVKETILKEIPTAKVDVMELDLSSLASVRKFASEYKSSGLPLNLLINNAGVMATPFLLSHDSIELQFATNHLGICFDKINDESAYNSVYAYGQSKLANVLHANELAKRLQEEGVEITANSLHPGSIATNLLRYHSFLDGIVNMVGKYVLKNIPQGAATTCYVALHPQVKGVSGEYFSDSNIAKPSSKGKDAELGKKLWEFSISLTEPK